MIEEFDWDAAKEEAEREKDWYSLFSSDELEYEAMNGDSRNWFENVQLGPSHGRVQCSEQKDAQILWS